MTVRNKKIISIIFLCVLLFVSRQIKAQLFERDLLHSSEINPSVGKAYFKIFIKEAWQLLDSINLSLSPVKAGIIDTGVEAIHPEFNIGVNFGLTPASAKKDSLTKVDDELRGHGTGIVGIIGANNLSATQEIPRTPVDKLQMNGILSGVNGLNYVLEIRKARTSIQIASNIYELVNSGVQIINISQISRLLIDAPIFDLSFEFNPNVLFVLSAGNSGLPVAFFTPANLGAIKNVITVGATDLNDQRALFSNFGSAIGIAAPGTFVYIPDVLEKNGIRQSDIYDSVGEGTSFSAPLVTGVAGILKAIKPELTPGEIKDILQKSADPIKTDQPLGSGCFDSNNNPQGFNGCRLNALKTICHLKILNCAPNPLIKDLLPGRITTIAGNGIEGFSGDGGLAKFAQLLSPSSLAFDKLGNLFIVDSGNSVIRSIDVLNGVISTVFGEGIFQPLFLPFKIVFDAQENFYITDRENDRVIKVNKKTKEFTTIAGLGEQRGGFSGDGGPAILARLSNPFSVAIDKFNNIFIADRSNHRIRRIDAVSGIITTVVGTGQDGFNGDGISPIESMLDTPIDIVFDNKDNLLIADAGTNRIRKVDFKNNIITTIAGIGFKGFGDDGELATMAHLWSPQGLAIDKLGNIFISDTLNHRIRRIDAKTGIITTVAGTGLIGFKGGGYSGDGGPAIFALLKFPRGITLDDAGNLFIADSLNHRIRGVRLSP